jgi:hypothetical protein
MPNVAVYRKPEPIPDPEKENKEQDFVPEGTQDEQAVAAARTRRRPYGSSPGFRRHLRQSRSCVRRERNAVRPRGALGSGASGTANRTCAGRTQPRTYLLNQSIVRCQARSAAALLYRSGVASQLKPCTAPG